MIQPPDEVAHVADAIDALARSVEALGSRRDLPPPTIQVFRESVLFSGNFPSFSWSVRMRMERFIVVADVFDRFTMTIGTASYRFAVQIGHDGIFELPFIVEPGQEVRFDPDAAGNLFVVYVVAYPV